MKSVQRQFVYLFHQKLHLSLRYQNMKACTPVLLYQMNGWLFVIFLYIMVGESGQCVFLQTTVSVSFPIQLLLPCNGTGFEQFLWRVVVPSLHVTEHALKCAHTLQIPSTKELSRIDKVKAPYILFDLKSFICMLYWLSINIYICPKCSCIDIHTRTNSFRRNKNMYYFFIIMLSYFDTFQIQCH